MNDLAQFRLETRISYLHCYNVGSGEGFVRACCGSESWQLTGVSDAASLGRQASKWLRMHPGRKKLTLEKGKRKEGNWMFIVDVKIS